MLQSKQNGKVDAESINTYKANHGVAIAFKY